MRALPGLFCLLLSLPASAQVSLRDSGDAAHLFAYRAQPGQQDAFDAGYRQHLAWHREHADPLVWYGWDVVDGPNAGMFVDGSFGAPFAAFDQRVDPAGDGADAARHFSPHAIPQYRASYRLRRDLSSAFPLEQWRPTARMEVTHYTVAPGSRALFEEAVALAKQNLPSGAAHSWYELVSGGEAGYLLLIARQGWADYDQPADHLDALLARSKAPRAQALRQQLTGVVASARTETWEYRPDMSLMPAR
ncbi:hypothetical protein [Pseudoxanthomonas indica]|uniref:NIPSNAP protein n=1 Tax=Pseudoxanthomonas indica TaxID=428993 RepID=A0A1T5LXF2_9GAMM|nr:hypothetical protein [Pseudoxanthomonas indica]GGD41859.1 hypothetical protein GCM10007235_12400 [Pseudoxanthomonas indica]SKC80690.1 hypothetical protein SAMN06296058_3368 [Pseudoxanthomonas indica]